MTFIIPVTFIADGLLGGMFSFHIPKRFHADLKTIVIPRSDCGSSRLVVRGTEEEALGSQDCSFLEYIIRNEHSNDMM